MLSERAGQPASAAWAALQQIVLRFEDAWERGAPPNINDFLPADADQRRAVLIELVHVDLERRLAAGEAARVEQYLGRYPELCSDAELLLELAATEYERRRAKEAGLTTEEYFRRFPDHRTALASRLGTDKPAAPSAAASTINARGRSPHPISARPPAVGAVSVPGYEVLEELGRGGMGVVYKARHTALKRLVALKMILDVGLARQEARARFTAEAEAIARLRHPNIVQIYEVSTHEGRPFFSLEYADGGSLAKQLDGTPQPPHVAAELVETLARAMHAAHQAGVIHRDLKPANVLLQVVDSRSQIADSPETIAAQKSAIFNLQSAIPKISDFGLAKQLDDASGQTQTGDIMGTPSYMAPEQAAGDLRAIGPATDVYALGAILYEMLTGRPPFKAATPLDTLEQVRQAEPVPPRALQPKTPRDLETICLKCLQKERGRRYLGAEALAEDLRRFLAGEPIRARPVGRAERLWMWGKRRPLAAALLGVAVALVLVTTVAVVAIPSALILLQSTFALQDANNKLDDEKGRVEKLKSQAEQSAASEKQAKYDMQMNLAEQALTERDVARARRLLADQVPKEGDADLRGFEWYYLSRQCQTRHATLEPGAGRLTGLALSPDGKRVAVVGSAGPLKVWDTEAGRELASQTAGRTAVAYSANGKLLAAAGADNTILICDAITGEVLHTCRGHGGPVLDLAFSPDGKKLVSGSKDRMARLWDVDTGTPGEVLRIHKQAVQAVAFQADGTRVATAGKDSSVAVWDVVNRRLQAVLNGPEKAVFAVAFSADGKQLASAGEDGTVRVWDVSALQPGTTITVPQFVLSGHTLPVLTVAFSPDGRRLASGGQDQTVRLWDLATRQAARRAPGGATREPDDVVFHGHGDAVNKVVFSRIGRRLISASSDQTVKFWDPLLTQGARSLHQFGFGVPDIAFSPDGLRLATLCYDGSCSTWKLESGEQLQQFKTQQEIPHRVAYSADGSLLATTAWDSPGAPRPFPHLAARRTPGDVRVWDTHTGKEAVKLAVKHSGEIVGASFLGGGRTLVAADVNGGIVVWDTATGNDLHTLEQGGPITAFAVALDGCQAATVGDKVVLWDLENGRQNRILPLEATQMVRAAAFSADGRHFAVPIVNPMQSDYPVLVWDVATGQEIARLRGHRQAVWSVAFSPDGRRLASGSGDHTVKVWDLATGYETLTLRGHKDTVLSVAFSPDGRRLASGGADQAVFVWEAGPAVETIPYTVPELLTTFMPEPRHTVLNLVWLPDSQSFVTFGFDMTIRLWDRTSAQPRQVLRGEKSAHCLSATVSPDGKLLAVGSKLQEFSATGGKVVVWDLIQGKELFTLQHQNPVIGLAFAADSKTLASSSQEGIRLWEMPTGKPLSTIDDKNAFGLAFADEGKAVAGLTRSSAAGGPFLPEVGVWDVATSKRKTTFPVPQGMVNAVLALGAGGTLLAAPNAAGQVVVWDVNTKKQRAICKTTGVAKMAFSPDGAYLATAGADGFVFLWDTATGAEVARFEADKIPLQALSFSPDGKLLAAADTRTIRLWDVPTPR